MKNRINTHGRSVMAPDLRKNRGYSGGFCIPKSKRVSKYPLPRKGPRNAIAGALRGRLQGAVWLPGITRQGGPIMAIIYQFPRRGIYTPAPLEERLAFDGYILISYKMFSGQSVEAHYLPETGPRHIMSYFWYEAGRAGRPRRTPAIAFLGPHSGLGVLRYPF
jgi:hypothetical protein